MIELRTPRGLRVQVPESIAEDPSPRFGFGQAAALKQYYSDNGYVIVKGLVDPASCEHLRSLWAEEVKPSDAFIYRQATAKAERHQFNGQGWVMNPILNLQSVDPKRYPRFRSFATDRILTAPALVRAFRALLGEQPKIVQSMYFEGNSATWEHQDSYYLDSERVGSMAAAWIAMQDIAATAGRFFVCPKSHLIDLGRQTFKNNIADHHEDYIQSVVQKVRELDLPIRAPCLLQGDVLLWNAWTIHGSLDSQNTQHARASVTCHAIADSHRFLQLQTRLLQPPTTRVNDVNIHCPKDLAQPRNQAIFHFETHYPGAFYWSKRMAIRWMMRFKRGATASAGRSQAGDAASHAR